MSPFQLSGDAQTLLGTLENICEQRGESSRSVLADHNTAI
jgi:hypothetical protein